MLYGRGAADMKSAIAAFAAAAARHLAKGAPTARSPSHHRRRRRRSPSTARSKMLAWLKEQGRAHRSLHRRRADLDRARRRHDQDRPARIDEYARDGQGHARPCRLSAPRRTIRFPALAELVTRSSAASLDDGTAAFRSFHACLHQHRCRQCRDQCHSGRSARSLQHPLQRPAHARKSCSKLHRRRRKSRRRQEFGCEIVPWIQRQRHRLPHQAGRVHRTRSPRRSPDVTGRRPEFSTGGGTSDARFIKDFCPVAELGLVKRHHAQGE